MNALYTKLHHNYSNPTTAHVMDTEQLLSGSSVAFALCLVKTLLIYESCLLKPCILFFPVPQANCGQLRYTIMSYNITTAIDCFTTVLYSAGKNYDPWSAVCMTGFTLSTLKQCLCECYGSGNIHMSLWFSTRTVYRSHDRWSTCIFGFNVFLQEQLEYMSRS